MDSHTGCASERLTRVFISTFYFWFNIFWWYFFPSSNSSSKNLPPSYAPNIMFFLSPTFFLKQTKYAPKLKKQRRQKKIPNPNLNIQAYKQKVKKKKAWGLLCVGQLLLSHNMFWVLLIHLASLCWRKWVFPLSAGINHKQFLVRDGTLYPPTPFLSAETVYGLNLCRYCMCYHSVWVHMCISPVWLGRYSFRSLHAPSIPGS